jgi:hypothetical protein
VALKKIKRIVNFLQKYEYRETGFNATKIAITEIASTTDTEPKLFKAFVKRKRNDAIENLCSNVFQTTYFLVNPRNPHSTTDDSAVLSSIGPKLLESEMDKYNS